MCCCARVFPHNSRVTITSTVLDQKMALLVQLPWKQMLFHGDTHSIVFLPCHQGEHCSCVPWCDVEFWIWDCKAWIERIERLKSSQANLTWRDLALLSCLVWVKRRICPPLLSSFWFWVVGFTGALPTVEDKLNDSWIGCDHTSSCLAGPQELRKRLWFWSSDHATLIQVAARKWSKHQSHLA